MLDLMSVLDRYAKGKSIAHEPDEFEELVRALFPEPEAEAVATLQRAFAANEPFDLAWGDIAAERGRTEVALRSYEVAVRTESLGDDDTDNDLEAERLSQVGRFLLSRAASKLQPVQTADAEDDVVLDAETGKVLSVGPGGFRFGDGPAFPASYEPQLVELAACAFARARLVAFTGPADDVEWVDRDVTYEECWQALLALDGLRCCTVMMGAFDDLAPVLVDGMKWCNELYTTSMEDHAQLLRNTFQNTEWWLRGRKNLPLWELDDEGEGASFAITAEGGGADTASELRFLRWQLNTYMDEVRLLRETKQVATDDLARTIAGLVSAEFTKERPDLTQIMARLSLEFRPRWDTLPKATRRVITQAEYVSSLLESAPDADWAPTIVQLSRALETFFEDRAPLLRRMSMDKIVPNRPLADQQATPLRTLGEFQHELREIGNKLQGLRKKQISDLSKGLRDVVDERNIAAHGDRHIDKVRALAFRGRLLDAQAGLLWEAERVLEA